MTHFSLVEAYNHDDTVELGGRTMPATALIEDDDGIRILLVPDSRPIPAELWIRAHTAGAQALLRAQPLAFATSTVFMDERTEDGIWHSYSLPERYWTGLREPVGYLQMAMPYPESVETPDPDDPDGGRPETGFVHLHTHSEFSALDGASTIVEMIEAVAADGQKALGVADHGNCALHPELALEAEKAGIKPIFGMEAYFVPDRHARGPEHRYAYQHLCLFAMDDIGLRNLWAISTEGFRTGEYDRKARIDWEVLEAHAEGVIATTACLRGPLLHPWLDGREAEALSNLGRLRRIFGDRLYIELHANHLPEQIRGNKWLIDVARDYEVPLIAVVDSHYAHRDDRDMHRVWLSIQTDKDIGDDSSLFAGGQDYHLMTGAEVREALAYLPEHVAEEAILNTGRLADRCTAKIRPKKGTPTYSKPTMEWPDPVLHDEERLMDECMRRWEERTFGKSHHQDIYLERFEREMRLLIAKGFCGYFLMVMILVRYAKENGVLVGPGRGSGGGSLVAYLIGITEIDPVESDLLFERFMTEGRTSLPDFDIDFPSSRKQFMLDFIERTWGADHVATVGTHLRLKNKAAIKDTFRAMQSTLPEDYFTDANALAKIVDEAEASTAGLGLSWEELWAQHGDQLQPYKEKYPHVFGMIERVHGRLKTYGRHPAGVIIDPTDPLAGALPLRGGEDGSSMVTQWDMRSLEALGFVKFDLLNIRTLDTIQQTVDLIRERRGHEVVPYTWREEYEDPYVWDEVSDGWTLGLFQIETSSGTRLVKRFRPSSVAELSDVITLVRPGPMRSGLTEIYFRRRKGDEEVTFADPRLEAILAKTYGTMLYQEDIMAVTMVLAGYGSDEADGVRKILGKKKVELVLDAGQKFVARAVENDTDRAAAEHLWEQMAEFAKYSFGRAHAYGYAMLAYWTAWLKFHYPIEFLTAALSTVDQNRVPEFVEETRRMGYKVLPPDINESGEGFTATDMAIRYGLASVKHVGGAAVKSIMENRPFTGYSDFLDRKAANAGVAKILVHIGAFDSLVPNRRGLEKWIEVESIAGSDRCVWKDVEHRNEHSLPCRFDWSSEKPEIGRSGKPRKLKPPPKKCTKACRMFTPLAPPDPETVPPYTDEDIRQIEMGSLGVFLSSTPFDRIPEEMRAELSTAADVLTGPDGEYLVAAVIKSVRPKPGGDSMGRPMGWLKLTTERAELDVVVFATTWDRQHHRFTPGALVLAHIKKNPRGQSLVAFENLDEES